MTAVTPADELSGPGSVTDRLHCHGQSERHLSVTSSPSHGMACRTTGEREISGGDARLSASPWVVSGLCRRSVVSGLCRRSVVSELSGWWAESRK